MKNLSYVGLCWTMTLGLVAVALAEPQQARTSDTRQILNGPAVQLDQQREIPAPAGPQDASLITIKHELPDPKASDGQPRRELGVWMGETGGPGVQILRITGGSAAEQAGLRVGDIILQVNGRGASSPQVTANLIKEIATGETGALTVWRDGNQQQVKVTLQPVREIVREKVKQLSQRVGSGRSDSTESDLASRTMQLEQQINALKQELATLRQELAQLRNAGPVQTGFNADANQGTAPRETTRYNITTIPAPERANSSSAAPIPASATAPPPGFEPPKATPPQPTVEPAKPAEPTLAAPAPASAPTAEKSAPDDLFGASSAPPKSEEKPKQEEKPKADDKAGSDDLFK